MLESVQNWSVQRDAKRACKEVYREHAKLISEAFSCCVQGVIEVFGCTGGTQDFDAAPCPWRSQP